MKRFFRMTLATTGVALALTTGLAGATASSTQCKGQPQVFVAASGYKKVTASNTNFYLGNAADLVLTGSGNCVLGSSADDIHVTGNNNYVQAAGSSTHMSGTGNFFQSQGNNFVNCGGGQANVDPNTDGWHNCVIQ